MSLLIYMFLLFEKRVVIPRAVFKCCYLQKTFIQCKQLNLSSQHLVLCIAFYLAGYSYNQSFQMFGSDHQTSG